MMKKGYTGNLMGNRQRLAIGGTPTPSPLPPPTTPITPGIDFICPKGYVQITTYSHILGQPIKACVPKSVYSNPYSTPMPVPPPSTSPIDLGGRRNADGTVPVGKGDKFFVIQNSNW